MNEPTFDEQLVQDIMELSAKELSNTELFNLMQDLVMQYGPAVVVASGKEAARRTGTEILPEGII